MSGMVTTGDTNISSYGSRTLEITVTGVARQDIAMRNSNYTMKVPYSRLSSTIQNIIRMGGKVEKVTTLPASSTSTEENN
ncbi:phycobilisome linker polypeptide [Myxosarcina sp. GI1]|uniref:phycobilisome linker polypeptide n=1 Tax=Myxosarcina sp. GI1 TaxID=1541065 RepID=UPI00056389FA|nr:phycobilisome linker polypeptide [Myxosarcina sp. GI1]